MVLPGTGCGVQAAGRRAVPVLHRPCGRIVPAPPTIERTPRVLSVASGSESGDGPAEARRDRDSATVAPTCRLGVWGRRGVISVTVRRSSAPWRGAKCHLPSGLQGAPGPRGIAVLQGRQGPHQQYGPRITGRRRSGVSGCGADPRRCARTSRRCRAPSTTSPVVPSPHVPPSPLEPTYRRAANAMLWSRSERGSTDGTGRRSHLRVASASPLALM